MNKKFTDVLSKLTPKAKRYFVIGIAVFVIVALGVMTHFIRSYKMAGKEPKAAKKEIKLNTGLLEKSTYMESNKKITNLDKKVEDLEKELASVKKGQSVIDPNAKDSSLPLSATTNQQTQSVSPSAASKASPAQRQLPAGSANNIPVPVPPGQPGRETSSFPSSSRSGQAPPGQAYVERNEFLGGIGSVSYHSSDSSKSDDLKKKNPSIFLPPSFMAATLLSGLDAPTMNDAKAHPVPVILRINDLAFLPNQVKADLKGCFVLAEGTGSLATERAELRLVTLSCLSKRGKSVINQSVKGFIVDSDGKIGLRGTVVSKMGSVIARTFLAGLVQGFGDAFKQSTYTSSISALGTTQTIDSGQIAKAGLGQGVSTAASTVAKFYLDLARQTIPVIEIGAMRAITIVISEGVDLNIRDLSDKQAF